MANKKCPNCNAKLKSDAYYCDYCGHFFENEQKNIELNQKGFYNKYPQEVEGADNKNQTFEKAHSNAEITDDKLKEILIQCNKLQDFSVVMLLMFIIIIISSINLIYLYSLFVIIFITTSSIQASRQALIALYKKDEYDKAYIKLNAMYKQKKEVFVIKQLVLLSYYKFENFEKAKTLIKTLNKLPHTKDENIKKIAQKLMIEY